MRFPTSCTIAPFNGFGLALVELLIAVTLTGCPGGQAENGVKQAAAPGVPVTVAKVESKTMPVRLTAIGNAEAYATVAVKARIDGQIDKAYFREGQDVNQGDLLFQLDPRPLRAQLQQAEAKLAGDRAQLQNARAKDQRYQDLLAQHFVSKEFYAQVRTDFDSMQANVRADEAALENARVQLEYSTIRSPISGRTGKIMIQPGNLVKANDTNALVVINQITPIYVNFAVPEQYLDLIRQGLAGEAMTVTVAPPNSGAAPASGRLAFIDNTVDTTTGTIRLKAVFRNEDKALWPGEFLNVSLTLKQQPNAIVVPSQAIQSGPKGQYVFVVQPDQSVQVREVWVDRVENNETVITKGLNGGEQIVVSGQLRLTPGTKVSIKPAEGAA